jgi:hypothetical protein
MNVDPRSFFKNLLVVSGSTAAVLLALHQLDFLAGYGWFSAWSLLFFIGLSIALFYLGRRVAASQNKNHFIQLTLVSVFGKIFLSVGLVALFHFGVKPVNKFALIPFFVIYFFFTVLETLTMTKLGRLQTKT